MGLLPLRLGNGLCLAIGLVPVGGSGGHHVLPGVGRILGLGSGLNTLLLTGLINSQSVRTAEMLDIPCLVFVRGKMPQKDAVQRAEMILPSLPFCRFSLISREVSL